MSFPDTAPDLKALSKEARRLWESAQNGRTKPGQDGEDELVGAKLAYVQSPGTDYANVMALRYADEFARLDLPMGSSGFACLVEISEDYRESYALAVTGGVFAGITDGRGGFRGSKVPRIRFEARSDKRDCDSDRVYMVRFEIEYAQTIQVAREATIIEGILREPGWYPGGTSEPAESGSDLYRFTPPLHPRLDGLHCRVILTDTLHEIGR